MPHEYAAILLYENEHTLVKANGEIMKFMMKIEQDGRVVFGSDDTIEIEATLSNMTNLFDTISHLGVFTKEWDSCKLPCNHPGGPYLQPNAVATIWMEGNPPEVVFSHHDELVFLDAVGRMGWGLVEFNGKYFMKKKIE